MSRTAYLLMTARQVPVMASASRWSGVYMLKNVVSMLMEKGSVIRALISPGRYMRNMAAWTM